MVAISIICPNLFSAPSWRGCSVQRQHQNWQWRVCIYMRNRGKRPWIIRISGIVSATHSLSCILPHDGHSFAKCYIRLPRLPLQGSKVFLTNAITSGDAPPYMKLYSCYEPAQRLQCYRRLTRGLSLLYLHYLACRCQRSNGTRSDLRI